MESVGASRKVTEYIERAPRIQNDGDVDSPIQGKISLAGVTFAYPSRDKTNVLEVSGARAQIGGGCESKIIIKAQKQRKRHHFFMHAI